MSPEFIEQNIRQDLRLDRSAAITDIDRKIWREHGYEHKAQSIWNGNAKFRAERGIKVPAGREGETITYLEAGKPKTGEFVPTPARVGETDEERVVRVREEEADHFAQQCRREAGIDVKPGVTLSHDEYLQWRAQQSWGRRPR